MVTAALLVTLCLGQAPAPPTPAKPAAATPAAASAAASGPASTAAQIDAAGSTTAGAVFDVAEGTARLCRAIIARDLETLVMLTPAPFSFDGVLARTPAEVRQHWAETLDRHPVERLRLYGVEVQPYPQLVEKYGPPPARLASVGLKDTKVGIANLSGRPTLVAWKRKGSHGLTAVAISD